MSKDKKEKAPPLNAKEELSDFARTALIAIVLALIIRTFLYEPFNIPSGSMKPTLDVGDYLFVYKPAYGYSQYSFPFGLIPIEGRIKAKEPKRGDVLVFWNSKSEQNYIKRLIGMPGDTVQMRQGQLYINGDATKREALGYKTIYSFDESREAYQSVVKSYKETLPNDVTYTIYEESDDQPLDNTTLIEIPEGNYFMMGDNRDNSQDSRVDYAVGFVPFENIVGRADFIFFSTNGKANLFEFWKWPQSTRWNRIFNKVE